MELETFRPIVSGAIGGVVATWLISRWSKSLPQTFQGKARCDVVREHRTAVWVANALFFVGLFGAVFMYVVGGFSRNDPTPVLIGFGFSGLTPMLALFAIATLQQKPRSEAFFAFAIMQGMPMGITYGIMVAASLLLPFGLYRIGT